MAKQKKQSKNDGKVSVGDLRQKLNKRYGTKLAWNLAEDDCPTNIKYWIPTGSKVLDFSIRKGEEGGIPSGKIVEIAGEEATGKSFMAAQILANAQKMGFLGVYFDSESSLSKKHMESMGVDTKNLLYVQAISIEMVFETIQELLGEEERFIFIWDSFANTAPGKVQESDDFDPSKTPALAARLNSEAMKKLTIPIANTDSCLIVLNQLKTNIAMGGDPRKAMDAKINPWTTPGGKALPYSYSLRIWLNKPGGKGHFIYDEAGNKIGSKVKFTLKKSRFGTEGRQQEFHISWGEGDAGVMDEESWYLPLALGGAIVKTGAWSNFTDFTGKTHKFYRKDWLGVLEDPNAKEAALHMLKDTLIKNYEGVLAGKDIDQLVAEFEDE